jgi:hypothetical protein
MSDKVLAMRWARWLILCVALVLATAPAAAQETFKSPEDAVDALIGAAKSGDKSAILRILGPNGRGIVSSGDEVADRTTRENFVAAYDTKHSLSPDGAAKTDLILGEMTGPSPFRSSARTGHGGSIRKRGSMRFYAAASAATSSPRSRSRLLTSRRRTNMPRSIRRGWARTLTPNTS